MEISLEKIELVKDRTGVNYKEAKDALIKADGSVVDAIIAIEEEIDITPKSKAGDQASQIIERMKELIHKGNISKITVKKDDEVILNIPLNVGILGVIWVFWPTLVATVVALGMKCTIDLVKDDGEIINLSSKAVETFGEMKENCSVIADDLKEKSGGAFSQVKEKAAGMIGIAKSLAEDIDDAFDSDILTVDVQTDDDDDYDDDYFNFDDFEEVPEDEPEAAAAKDSDIEETAVSESAPEEQEKDEEATVQEAADAAAAVNEETEVSDEIRQAEEKFEKTIEDYKKKRGSFRFF